jgi:hypothetical protein
MRLQIIKDLSAENVAAYEEAIVTVRRRGITTDVISIWKQPNVVYLPDNSSVLYFDTDYAQTFGFPIVRSPFFPASATSAIVVGNTWGILNVIGNDLAKDREYFENTFTLDAFKYLAKKYGLNLERVSNDLIIPEKGKKIAGIVTSLDDKCRFSNSFFNMKKHEGFDYDVFYNLPPSKFADKQVKSVNERIATFYEETGLTLTDEEIIETFKEYYAGIGIEPVEEIGLRDEEKAIFDEVKDKYRSEEWIKYGTINQKPDFQ